MANDDLTVIDSKPLPEAPLTVVDSKPLPEASATPAPERTWLDSATDLAKGLWSQVDPVAGVKGAAEIAAHPVQSYMDDAGVRQDILDKAEKSFKEGNYAEGMAHALYGIIPFLGQGADAAGEDIKSGKVALGVGKSVGMGLNLAGPGAVKDAALSVPGADALASKMYQTSLKPPPGSYSTSEVRNMVKTGLDSGIPVTQEGATKLWRLVNDLNSKITNQIKAGSSAGVTIPKLKVALGLGDTADKFKEQVNPTSDLAAVQKSGEDFMDTQPDQIAALAAQKAKVGTYKQLGDKAYNGELSSATTEAQKALARGIKEELEKQFPEIHDLNAEEGQLLNLQPALERAIRRTGNNNIWSLGGKISSGIGATVGGLGGGTEGAGVGAMVGPVLHYIMTDPAVQSKVAIAISKASNGSVTIPAAAARVSAYTNALGNARTQESTPPASGPTLPAGYSYDSQGRIVIQ